MSVWGEHFEVTELDFAHTCSCDLPATLGSTLPIFVEEETEAPMSCNLSKAHSWEVTEAEVQPQAASLYPVLLTPAS